VSGPPVFPEHVDLVLSALHGRDAKRAVTKAWLAMSTGLPDRLLRVRVERGRRMMQAHPAPAWRKPKASREEAAL
jgi:hypothetical protein